MTTSNTSETTIHNRFIRIEEELHQNGGALARYPGVGP